MEKVKFNDGWMIAETEGWLSDMPQYKPVEIPYDALCNRNANRECTFGASSGYIDGSLFEFKKDFLIPEEWKGKKIIIEFDGVLVNTEVVINRNYAAFHPNGYTPFLVDVTPYLLYGKSNRIIVRADSQLKSSRWYTGCGIYRDVYLRIGNKCHIKPWSLNINTEEISQNEATICVKAEIEHGDDEEVEVKYVVRDENEKEVATISASTADALKGIKLKISAPHLWSADTPHMYRLKCELYRNGEIIDWENSEFGIRILQWSAEKGLQVNGKTVKLRGGCLHHTNGVLGAVTNYEIEEKKIRYLKKIGFNAIRTAHNPPSSAFLEACDHVGMYVMSEFFDAWRAPKCVHDYHMFFDQWWDKDVTATVKRDYNHPSVIMWSIGNEITEVDGTSEGFRIAKMITDKTRELDKSRPITSGMILLPDLTGAETAEEIEKALSAFYPALPEGEEIETKAVDNIAKNTFCPIFSEERDYWGDTTKPFADALDIVGYNYMSERYEFDTKKFKDRIIVGAETFPGRIHEYWNLVSKLPNVIGDFCWTAQDFLGEAGTGINYVGKVWNARGKFPCRVSGTGDIDIIGSRNPLSYYRECVWSKKNVLYIVSKSPALNGKYIGIGMWGWDEVEADWTYPGYEGEITEVTVYSAAEEIALYLNGTLIGKNKSVENKAAFNVAYIPGKLEAVAYEGGEEIGRANLRTAENLSSYMITTAEIKENDEYLFFMIVAVDDKMNRIMKCDNEIYASAENANIVAFGNANPFVEESYVSRKVKLYKGQALLVLKRKRGEHGKIRITDTERHVTETEF